MKVWYRDYPDIVDLINECGVKNLKKYCESKKYPVKDFDKSMMLVRYTLQYGPSNASRVFGVSKQAADQTARTFWRYARECKAAKEDRND